MDTKRKIEPIVRKVSFAEAEEEDMLFWMNLTPGQRMEELLTLKQMIWGRKDKPYPTSIEKVVEKKIKSETDNDDF